MKCFTKLQFTLRTWRRTCRPTPPGSSLSCTSSSDFEFARNRNSESSNLYGDDFGTSGRLEAQKPKP
eukprot:g30088.t1